MSNRPNYQPIHDVHDDGSYEFAIKRAKVMAHYNEPGRELFVVRYGNVWEITSEFPAGFACSAVAQNGTVREIGGPANKPATIGPGTWTGD